MVKVVVTKYKPAKVTNGGPQVSIRGPLMFFLYIRNPPHYVGNFLCFGYPDSFKAVTNSLEDKAHGNRSNKELERKNGMDRKTG